MSMMAILRQRKDLQVWFPVPSFLEQRILQERGAVLLLEIPLARAAVHLEVRQEVFQKRDQEERVEQQVIPIMAQVL